MECYCYPRYVQDLLSDGKAPYGRRFGVPFNGPVIPFGSMIEYHPISVTDLSRLHQFGPKVVPGLFLGHALHAGRIWKGDILVADIKELERMDAMEIHAGRLNAKEVLTPMSGEKFMFPMADGKVKTIWRRSGSENIQFDTAQHWTRRRTWRSSKRIRRVFFTPTIKTHHGMTVKQKADFCFLSGEFIYRHHVEPRVKLYMPREESFPIPLEYIDVTRTTYTTSTRWWTSNKRYLVHVWKFHLPPSERGSHSQFHCETLTWPGLRIRPWMYCWSAALTIIGTSKQTEIYRTRGQVSHGSPCCMKNLQTDIHGPGGGWQKGKKKIQVGSLVARNMD